MRLVFLSLAIADLENIRAYIARENPKAAQGVAKELKQLIKQLSKLPNLGKPGRVFGTRELITPPIGKTAYVVVYRMQDNRLEVLRVLPGMRDIDRILGDEDQG
jgi:toxin ParE1/3/4